jgi:hypothetical protein
MTMSTLHTRNTSPYTWSKQDLFFGVLQMLALTCAIVQWRIGTSPENVACVTMVVASSTLVFQYLWRSGSTVEYPVSSLALLGSCFTTQFAALLAQTLDGTEFVALLRWPETTFAVLSGVQVLLVGTHWVYRHMAISQSISGYITEHVLEPIGAMAAPPVYAIWAMSVLGIVAMLNGGGAATGDVGGKFFQAFNFMAYIPCLIPIYYRQFGEAYCDFKIHGTLLAVYVGVMIVTAIVMNARQFMAVGPVQVGFIFLLFYWRDPQPITAQTLRRLAVITVLLGVAISFFADLSLAMVINRDKRSSVSRIELMKETWETLLDRERIEQFKQAELSTSSYKRYDETYLSNPMMARFSETKFHDNNIYFSTLTTDAERAETWQVTIDKAMSILPQPVIDGLDLKVDKNYTTYSFGDFYRYLSEGLDNTLGGFAVGSLWAHLITLFGLTWFPVVVVVLTYPAFVFIDSFSRKGTSRLDVAPVVMCSSWLLFSYAIGGESLVWKVGFYLRDLPQKVILYLMAYAAVKYGCLLFGKDIHSMGRTKVQGHVG